MQILSEGDLGHSNCAADKCIMRDCYQPIGNNISCLMLHIKLFTFQPFQTPGLICMYFLNSSYEFILTNFNN